MAFEDIFKTEKGSVYQFDHETRLWKRDTRMYSTAVYVGSIDSSVNPAIIGDYLDFEKMAHQLTYDKLKGFEPRFVIGYNPIGFPGFEFEDCTEGIEKGDNGIRLKYRWLIPSHHVGHKIIEIYKEIDLSGFL